MILLNWFIDSSICFIKKIYIPILVFTIFGTAMPQTNFQITDSSLFLKAKQLAKDFVMVDTHIDLPSWLYDEWFDVSQLTLTCQAGCMMNGLMFHSVRIMVRLIIRVQLRADLILHLCQFTLRQV